MLRRSGLDEYFELGSRERFLVSCFDGRHELSAIEAKHAMRFGEPLSERYLAEFVEQLRLAGLVEVETSAERQPAPVEVSESIALGPGLVAALALQAPRPLSARDPHGALNQAFDWLTLLFGWAVQPWMIAPVALLAWGGANVLVRHFDLLLEDAYFFRGQHSLIALLLMWYGVALAGLGLPTAILKGMVVRLHGGRLQGFGLRFYHGLVPYIECDRASSSWVTNRKAGGRP